MIVCLAHKPNPDIEGGYWTSGERLRPQWVKARDLAEARNLCLAFIAENDLGGGNWTGGEVRNDSGSLVAYISYNGRVWRDRESFEEIKQ
jgi:hypothetical protein